MNRITSGSAFIAANPSRSASRQYRSTSRSVSILRSAELIEEPAERHGGLRHEVEAHVLIGCVHPRVGMRVADRDHRQLLRVADLVLGRRARAGEEPERLLPV